MAARKIQNEQEVIRWFDEGRTYEWMQREYLRKYHIETVSSMWGNFRRRRGLDRRSVRNDTLIPWFVERKHRWKNPVVMLRTLARQREGMELNEEVEHSLASWLRSMAEQDTVVHYDPETEQGFFYVPRRRGTDKDMIREPERKTTERSNADRD